MTVTLTSWRPPKHALKSTGATEYVHAFVPAWVTTNVWPPTVIVPVRAASPAFAATEYEMRRFPVPNPPTGSVMLIQGAFAMTVQLQLDAAATSNVPVPPATPNASSSSASVTVHVESPACVTVCAAPPAVTEAVRDTASGFAATE